MKRHCVFSTVQWQPRCTRALLEIFIEKIIFIHNDGRFDTEYIGFAPNGTVSLVSESNIHPNSSWATENMFELNRCIYGEE